MDTDLTQVNTLLQEYADIQILADFFREFEEVRQEVKQIIECDVTEQVADNYTEAERLCNNYLKIRKILRRLHTLFMMYAPMHTIMHGVVPEKYLEALALIDNALHLNLYECFAESLLSKYEEKPYV
jgi:hypothetical protein